MSRSDRPILRTGCSDIKTTRHYFPIPSRIIIHSLMALAAKFSMQAILLRSPPALRPLFIRHVSQQQLPRVVQPSLWASMIPPFLRRSRSPASDVQRPRKVHNPWGTIIVLALMVGSQAIHTMSLKSAMKTDSRKAEVKLELLREVIERVQKGEDVDVEAMLGTGDPKAEEEWWDGKWQKASAARRATRKCG